jgi:hypothetical protein
MVRADWSKVGLDGQATSPVRYVMTPFFREHRPLLITPHHYEVQPE